MPVYVGTSLELEAEQVVTPSSPPDENASLQAIAAALDLSSAVGLRRESYSQEEQGTGTDLVSVLSNTVKGKG